MQTKAVVAGWPVRSWRTAPVIRACHACPCPPSPFRSGITCPGRSPQPTGPPLLGVAGLNVFLPPRASLRWNGALAQAAAPASPSRHNHEPLLVVCLSGWCTAHGRLSSGPATACVTHSGRTSALCRQWQPAGCLKGDGSTRQSDGLVAAAHAWDIQVTPHPPPPHCCTVTAGLVVRFDLSQRVTRCDKSVGPTRIPLGMMCWPRRRGQAGPPDRAYRLPPAPGVAAGTRPAVPVPPGGGSPA